MEQNSFSITKYFYYGFGLILTLFVLVGVVSWIGINSLGNLTSTIYKHPLEVSNAALRASMGVVKMHRSMKDVVLADEQLPLNTAILHVVEEEIIVIQKLDLIQEKILGAEGQALAKETRELFINWKPIRQKVIVLARKGDHKKAARITKGEGASHELIVEQKMLDLTSYARQKADGFVEQTNRVRNRINFIISLSVSFGFFLSLLIAFITAQKIKNSIVIRDKAEQKFKDFIMSANDGFILFDSELNLVTINNKALEIYPLESSKEDLFGKNIFDISPRFKQLGRYEKYLEVKNTGHPLYFEDLVFENTVFGDRHLTLKTFRVVDGLGMIFTDITERKKAEEALQKAHDELEHRVCERTKELNKTHEQLLHSEKLAAIGKLSASIAHEFNNPLYGIQSVLEGIRRNVTLDKDYHGLCDLALSECGRVKELIKSLQDFNKPSAGVKETVDIHTLLDDMIVMVKKEFKNFHITTKKQYTHELPMVTIIPDQIKQVFLNLLTNARDSITDESGNVTITTENLNDKVAIRIRDTGNGISSEVLPHIFEPFFTTKSAIKGTGLGLSVSYGIIQGHGGDILVDTVPGKGTIFSVILPLNREEK